MGEVTRRRVLAVAGATTMGAVAGCTGSGDEGDDGDEDGNEDDGDGGSGSGGPTGTVLGEITVENIDDDTHTVDVLVEFDGEIDDWTTVNLETSGDSITLERNWPSEPGPFRVVARVDGDEFTEVTPANWNDPDCFNLFISVREGGGITITSDTGDGPCGSGDAGDAEEAEG